MIDDLYHWRACDTLNLVQASLLTVGADPQDWRGEEVFDPKAPRGFDAIYQALLHAVNTFDEEVGYLLNVVEEMPNSRHGIQWRDGFFYHVFADDVRRWLQRKHIKSAFFFPEENLEIVNNKASESLDAGKSLPQQYPVRGPIFAKLAKALEEFPLRYAGKSPKLDDDVRPWLKESFGCNEREAFVFGAILAEHFDLSAKRG